MVKNVLKRLLSFIFTKKITESPEPVTQIENVRVIPGHITYLECEESKYLTLHTDIEITANGEDYLGYVCIGCNQILIKDLDFTEQDALQIQAFLGNSVLGITRISTLN